MSACTSIQIVYGIYTINLPLFLFSRPPSSHFSNRRNPEFFGDFQTSLFTMFQVIFLFFLEFFGDFQTFFSFSFFVWSFLVTFRRLYSPCFRLSFFLICIHVYIPLIFICIHVCIYVYMYVYIPLIFICILACIYVYMYVYIPLIFICIHVCIYVCIYVHTCINVNIICIYEIKKCCMHIWTYI